MAPPSALPSPEGAITVEHHATLAAVARDRWDALFPGSAEGYDLYRALEAVPPPGFTLGALTVGAGGRMIAAAPMFQATFRLDTPFQGRLRQITDRIHARAPRLTSLGIIGLGSPMSDNCSIGLATDLSPEGAAAARAALLDRLSTLADDTRAQVLVVKCLGPEAADWHEALVRRGYGRIRSVPVVMLAMPHTSVASYLASLPKKTALYLRRRLRNGEGIRLEIRHSVAGLEPRLMQLNEATLAQSGVDYGDFDKLHPGYFQALLEGVGQKAGAILCWKEDRLIGFHLFHLGERRFIANRIGMQYPEAREHSLYFVMWMRMIELAIAQKIPEIEMGATTYATKFLFGGELETRWIYFRLRHRIPNALSRPLHHLFDFERNDPELKKLRQAGQLAADGPSARPKS